MIISIANFKGGTAKTTTAVNLGYGLAEQGYKVLLVDTDPQSNLTYSVNLLQQLEHNLYTLYQQVSEGKQNKVMETIFPNIKGVAVLPAGIALATADLKFGGVPRREYMLDRILKPVKDRYDLIIIDCPPSMGLLTQNALAITDYVLIPTQVEFLPARGITIFIDAVKMFLGHGVNDELTIGGVLITRYDGRTILSRDLLEYLQESLPGLVFDTKIRQNIALSEAQANGVSIYEYAPDSNGAQDYKAFTQEVINRFTNG